jgi:hypothetical protein
MRTVSPPILRRLGFRRSLLANGVLVSLMMASLALVTIRTPHWALLAALLLLGFFRALQFTSMNTLAYSDLVGRDISSGSSVSSLAQQLSMSFGVAISATLLALSSGPAGIPTEAQFRPVFFIMAMFPLASLLWFVRLGPEDGSHVTGFRGRPGRR